MQNVTEAQNVSTCSISKTLEEATHKDQSAEIQSSKACYARIKDKEKVKPSRLHTSNIL